MYLCWITLYDLKAHCLSLCRIIDAFEDTVNVILLDVNFDEPLLVAEDDVALRAERVKQP